MSKDESEFSAGDGVRLWDRNKLEERLPDVRKAAYELTRLNAGQSRKNFHQKLKDYQRYSEELLKAHGVQSEVLAAAQKTIHELEAGMAENAGRRWSKEADEALVEMASRDDGHTVVTLAGMFGRSPGAVASRLSDLVGMRRITGEQYLRLSGQLNGKEVDGVFVGTAERVA